jgi:ADP-ribose pyrophosphatase YjhB (NUDIX family)
VSVVNDAGEILLIRRTDNGNWAVPGGAIDLGESVAQAAVRETLEESGIECAITGIVGIYSDPKHVILYTSNGEARQEFSIVLTARPLGGQPTPSSESSEVRWVPVSEILEYTMDRSAGFYIAPTIITDVPPESRVATEEIFAPVMVVLTYQSEKEALDIVTSTEFGLSTPSTAPTPSTRCGSCGRWTAEASTSTTASTSMPRSRSAASSSQATARSSGRKAWTLTSRPWSSTPTRSRSTASADTAPAVMPGPGRSGRLLGARHLPGR